MDIDSGNLTAVAQVKSKEHGTQQDLEVDVEKSGSEARPQSTTPEPIDPKDDGLPFSKARSAFFVLALTGAAFLNVRIKVYRIPKYKLIMFKQTLGVQVVVIILPSIGRALDVPSSRQQWIVSAYSLTFGCFLLLFGRIADVYGKRLTYLAGSAWFTTASILCPFMPTEIPFDVFRGFQGLASAASMSSALGILGQTFGPGKYKNYAFAVYGAGAPLGSVFG